MNLEETKAFADLCLNCKNPMCRKGCPIETRIPEFISKIKNKQLEEAYKILQDNNIMSEICSIICPSENQCMGKCIKGIKGEPIRINDLENFVNKWAEENNIDYKIKTKKTQNIKIAIIGSGPAGLACATELLKEGIDVTIFEKEQALGGLLEYGIPDFRLPKRIVRKAIEKLKHAGLKIKLGKEFGKDFTIEQLKQEGFKKIFLAIGAGKSNVYSLSEEENDKIYKSDNFLKNYSMQKKFPKLDNIIVIGGGNVAIDSARVAKKIGAKKVTILYRRNRELMPARNIEIEDALNDGVEIDYLTRVISADIKDNKIKEVKCIKTKIENEKAIDILNSEFTVKADAIIFAIGLVPDSELLKQNGIILENKLVKVNEKYETNIKDVYAGGDLVETKSTVCRAIATGKKVAKNILENIKD